MDAADDGADAFTVHQQGGPSRVDDPVDLPVRAGDAQRCDRGQRMQHIAHRADANDEDLHSA
jgi:hypothetical protein